MSMALRHRKSNFRWEMVTVYGPTQHNLSHVFLEELHNKCQSSVLPVVLGGDFNLIRKA